MKTKEKLSTIQTWSKLGPFFRNYPKQILGIGLMMTMNAVIDISFPLFSEYAVAHFVEPRETQGLLPYSLIFLAVICVQAASTVFFARMALGTEVSLSRDLRRSLFVKLQHLSFSYFNNTPVGSIMSRVLSDTERIGSVFAWSLVDIFWSLIYIIGCFAVMLTKNWRLALLILTIVPAVVLLTLYFQKKMLNLNREVRTLNAEITRQYNEGISGAKTSKTLVIEDKNTETFMSATKAMRDTTIRSITLNALYIPLIVFLTALAVAFVLTSGGGMILNETISVAQLTVFVSYALSIADPVQNLARTITNFISTQANIERCTQLLALEPDITDRPDVIARYGSVLDPKRENWEPLSGHITFDNVSFQYPDGNEKVLDQFTLDIPAGTNIAIVGETGAGKSTLVNLACRFFEPTEGRILIDGKDYRDRSTLWLHSNIGYVLQTPHLFSGSVRENIRYGKRSATDEEIETAAKLVNAHHFIMAMDQGYDSDVGEGGGNLSTGEKQLLSFARALLANPRIFVLDEATASIDTKTEALIQNAIQTLLQNRTSFLIAHRLSTIRRADLILVVRDGRIIERGSHRELMALNGYYAGLYRKQFEMELVEG